MTDSAERCYWQELNRNLTKVGIASGTTYRGIRILTYHLGKSSPVDGNWLYTNVLVVADKVKRAGHL